ncbi:MAG TPA: DUF1571 domain-containing protein [Planctomycetaceae bacterium]|jgi:hypothetical protein
MRSSPKEWLIGLFFQGIRRPIVPCLLLALLASPGGFSLEAEGKESRKARKERERAEAAEPVAEPAPANAGNGNKEPSQLPGTTDTGKDPATLTAGAEAAKPADKEKVAHKGSDATRLAAGDSKAAKALAPVLETARSSRESLRKMPGYTCTFIKREQIKKNSMITQSMTLKFRRAPFSVYLKSIDPNPGREVLYVEGRNNGKFYFHEGSGLVSLLGTLSLVPTCNDAMKESRHPITMIGMENMLNIYIRELEECCQYHDTQVQLYPQAKLGDMECVMYEISHPQQRGSLEFFKGRVYFDKKANLPIRVEQYAYPVKAGKEPQLVEEYNYIDVKLVDVTSEKDFDVKNEAYGFK